MLKLFRDNVRKGEKNMACFLVPAAEAVVAGVSSKVIKKNEKHDDGKIPFSTKLGWLVKMSSFGSILLLFEHIWHGEVVPFFPFLTNAVNAEDRKEMLAEMGTTGVLMAVLITVVWIGMLVAVKRVEMADKKVKKEV